MCSDKIGDIVFLIDETRQHTIGNNVLCMNDVEAGVKDNGVNSLFIQIENGTS